jgi:hypothetical protein
MRKDHQSEMAMSTSQQQTLDVLVKGTFAVEQVDTLHLRHLWLWQQDNYDERR